MKTISSGNSVYAVIFNRHLLVFNHRRTQSRIVTTYLYGNLNDIVHDEIMDILTIPTTLKITTYICKSSNLLHFICFVVFQRYEVSLYIYSGNLSEARYRRASREADMKKIRQRCKMQKNVILMLIVSFTQRRYLYKKVRKYTPKSVSLKMRTIIVRNYSQNLLIRNIMSFLELIDVI